MNIAQIFASNLHGFDYYRARKLSPKPRITHECKTCKQVELLPVVQQIVELEAKRFKYLQSRPKREISTTWRPSALTEEEQKERYEYIQKWDLPF